MSEPVVLFVIHMNENEYAKSFLWANSGLSWLVWMWFLVTDCLRALSPFLLMRGESCWVWWLPTLCGSSNAVCNFTGTLWHSGFTESFTESSSVVSHTAVYLHLCFVSYPSVGEMIVSQASLFIITCIIMLLWSTLIWPFLLLYSLQ